METKSITDPIALVFTMQKVGSSTMMNALRTIGRNPERGFEGNMHNLKPPDEYEKVLTAVRDPVARNISWFFELHGDEMIGKPLTVIRDHFFSENHIDHEYPVRWFETVFAPFFGIDAITGRLFARKRGWSIIENRFLIVRAEDMSGVLANAMKKLFGDRPEVEHRAETEITRQYGGDYIDFVDWVRFDRAYLDRMYNSRYVKHFYTAEEIKGFYRQWERK